MNKHRKVAEYKSNIKNQLCFLVTCHEQLKNEIKGKISFTKPSKSKISKNKCNKEVQNTYFEN